MDNILSLLGSDDGGFLFPHLFLRLLPTTVRAALANSPCLLAGDHRGLAEEVDRVLLATRRFHPTTPQQCAMFLPPAFRQQGSALHFSVHIRSVGKRRRRHAVAAVGPGEQEELLFIKGSLSGRVSWWTLVRRRASLRLHIKS